MAGCSYDDSARTAENRRSGRKACGACRNGSTTLNPKPQACRNSIDGKRFISDVTVEEDGSYTPLTLVTSTGGGLDDPHHQRRGRPLPKIGIKQDSDGKTTDPRRRIYPRRQQRETPWQARTAQRRSSRSNRATGMLLRRGRQLAGVRQGRSRCRTGSVQVRNHERRQAGLYHPAGRHRADLRLPVQFGIAFETTTGALQVGRRSVFDFPSRLPEPTRTRRSRPSPTTTGRPKYASTRRSASRHGRDHGSGRQFDGQGHRSGQ